MGEINYRALQAFFAADEIEWRVQQAGEKNGRIWAIAVPYVTNRAIQSRLDDVVGPANWRNEFRPGPDGGVMCGISIRVGDEWVTKWDGAENTDVEGVKGGLSAAMKRAAVQWGIGRYLYALDESFAQIGDHGRFRGKTRDGASFRWDPPELPAWALPPRETPTSATPRPFSEHDAMLEYIRAAGPRVPDEAQIRIDRRARDLKDFVRENWAAIKEQPRIARAVVFAIETATGTRFDFEPEGAPEAGRIAA
ncbi:MAG TPA: Rad52/Rad22 family DNA repair protein [Longimicrobium sp.]|nr:Rad52/Rad22 family DNA repair protein [Longimicrobium sp.]